MENTSQVPPKGLGKIHISDIVKGLWMAISAGVLAFGYFIISNHFKMPTMEQADPYLQTIAAGFLTYIAKNFGTNNVGEFLKPDKPVIVVGVEKLQEAIDKKQDEATP